MTTNRSKPVILLLILLFLLAGGGAYVWMAHFRAPVVSWPAPADIAYGTPLGTNQNNATATLPGTFHYSPTNGTVLGVGTNTLSVVFIPAASRFPAQNFSVPLVVAPARLTVIANDQSKTYGTTLTLGAGQTNFTSIGLVDGDSVTSVTLSSAGAPYGAGVRTYPIEASDALGNGLANYRIYYRSGLLTVKLSAPVVSWPAPASIVYGTPLGTAQNNATATMPGSFVYSPMNGTVLGAGTTLLQVVFIPTDRVFKATTSSVNLVVQPAPLTATADDVSRPFGQKNPVLSGTLTGVVNGDNITATYETRAGTNSPPGAYPILPVLVDPNGRLANYTVSSRNGTLTVTSAAGFIMPPADISSIPQREEELVQKEARHHSTNRLTLSLRFGLNIQSHFSGIGLTPGGGNYFDGYVLTDSTGNFLGYTSFWGYNNASQYNLAANTFTFHNPTGPGNSTEPSDSGSPNPGVELKYNRQLYVKENWHHLRLGLEAALNYLRISLKNNSSFNTAVAADDYTFGGIPGQIPSPGYRGSYSGNPGDPVLVAGGTPAAATTGTLQTRDNFDANLFGGRLGPYVELPFGKEEQLTLALSAGLAVGFLNADESWHETLTFAGGGGAMSGGGNKSDFLWGWYAGANADYQLSEHWGVAGGVQFQDLGTYNHSYDGRQVSLDLSRSIFFLLGVSYHF